MLRRHQGIYLHGVLFPHETVFFREFHSWQRHGRQFFIRTVDGGRADIVATAGASALEVRLREIGIPNETIMDEPFTSGASD